MIHFHVVKPKKESRVPHCTIRDLRHDAKKEDIIRDTGNIPLRLNAKITDSNRALSVANGRKRQRHTAVAQIANTGSRANKSTVVLKTPMVLSCADKNCTTHLLHVATVLPVALLLTNNSAPVSHFRRIMFTL